MNTVMSESIVKIAAALLKAQKNMGAALKDAKNPFFKSSYADLNAVREASHPALNAEGITVLQPMVQKDGVSYVRTLLLHESGEYIGSDTAVVCSKQNDPQSYGSAVSYARRYGLQTLVSLGATDDDGEGATARSAKPVSTKTESTVTETVAAAPAKAKTSSFRKPKSNGTEKVDSVTITATEDGGWT